MGNSRTVVANAYSQIMDTTRLASTVLAALELVPGEPWDLTEILRRPAEREALLGLKSDVGSLQLTGYLRDNLHQDRVEHWQKRLEQLARSHKVYPLIVGEPGYPALLLSCWDAPPVLFVRGSLPTGTGVAIVGSRNASAKALADAANVGAEVAGAGLVVVSGLASGIDSAAHKAALSAGGVTVAVMGTGIENIYPRENSLLAEEIVDSGALLSQFAPDAPRTGTTFLRRNRVIAGLANVSLIMEGLERSGSRHELEQALSYKRPVLLWRPGMGRERWARELVSSGSAVFVSTPREVVNLAVDSS